MSTSPLPAGGLDRAVDLAGGTQLQLAELLGVHQSTVASWFRRGVPVKQVPKICEALYLKKGRRIHPWELRPDFFAAPRSRVRAEGNVEQCNGEVNA